MSVGAAGRPEHLRASVRCQNTVTLLWLGAWNPEL